ncbi:MAG: alpha-ribazole phosphatase [Gammaproteobacteria bacterium]|nr:alpha-ribazole phosphatase [Gammaproteobacteria bacterium]
MDIYLIRHTRTDTEHGLCYGQSDVPLAESFPDEVKKLKAKLPQLPSDCLIISSPLGRCMQLARTFSGPLSVDQRLQEINFGAWENQRFDDIDPVLLQQWTENFVILPPPNGESFGNLYQRVSEFWLELVANKLVRQVVVITHAGVIRALLAHVLELKLEYAFMIGVGVGSVHKLRHSNDYTYVDYLNR